MNSVWSYIAKMDGTDRFVLPTEIRRGLLGNADRIYMVLSESENFGKYIKLISTEFMQKDDLDPFTCDSLDLVKTQSCLIIPVAKNGRINILPKGRERLFEGVENPPREINCISLKKHIAITTKKIEEILLQKNE